ncbi:unnamed protein product, partial [Scytosiphon promiscuus]
TKVPGIGPAAVSNLAMEKDGSITNTYQLMGKFLALAPDEVDPMDHCDRFWSWLQTKKMNVHRATIVLAIAEKVNMAYPG